MSGYPELGRIGGSPGGELDGVAQTSAATDRPAPAAVAVAVAVAPAADQL